MIICDNYDNSMSETSNSDLNDDIVITDRNFVSDDNDDDDNNDNNDNNNDKNSKK